MVVLGDNKFNIRLLATNVKFVNIRAQQWDKAFIAVIVINYRAHQTVETNIQEILNIMMNLTTKQSNKNT